MKFNSSKPRKFGKAVKPCRRCGKTEGVVHKYGLSYCRQCFREIARELGFEKYQ
ncbi:MAG: 30S ribosomal protein S14 [Candidatus Aenigmarchaeota archaeon]|nr:30S ribosomal protein S14 [Candidatus Aenigmarchaeota archaeon]